MRSTNPPPPPPPPLFTYKLFTHKLWPTPLLTNIMTPNPLHTSLPAPMYIYAHCLFHLLFLSIISTAYHLLSGSRAARLLLNWSIDWLKGDSGSIRYRRHRFSLRCEEKLQLRLPSDSTEGRVDWKWRTWKWRTIKIAGHEIAGHENARYEIGGQTTEK